MKKTILLLVPLFSFIGFSGCVNKHGVSMKYYSDCKEYYDLQGYYHKECGEDDMFTYEGMRKAYRKKKKDPNLIEGEPFSN